MILIWAILGTAIVVPIAAAAASPLLAWRDPIYISAGFAGILALALLLVQPLLAGGYLPGLAAPRGRRVHRVVGGVLVAAVTLHVAGLWITSPPDVIDALLFRAPTLFSVWGVIAVWTVLAAALAAALRRRMKLRPRTWRLVHTSLAAVTVLCSAAHVLPIEGTMETVSKAVLCTMVVAATLKVGADLGVWGALSRQRLTGPSGDE
ncbi:ferric reductase-like transmembrane domain-containing protein [Thalassobaculum sp.]|uniref:ferric reductase-like transmembrane domain-containing protein n=1 Tax=Thalassobaculum sp. TaxID=2022740 RepID=UPI0032ED6EB1